VTSIRTVASLITALTILQVALGLLGVHLPLMMDAGAFSQSEIGLVSAAYSAGFMAGAWLGPSYLARIGHIRVFAAGAAFATALVLAIHWTQGLPLWMINRFAIGAVFALVFTAGESWMSGAIGKSERGNTIGFYMVCTKAALAFGPFLIASSPPTAAEPLMIAAILIALAMAPICLTSQAQPEPPQAQPLAIREQFRTAPAAVIACFGAGLINAGVLTIAPLYAQERFGVGAAAGFVAAAWLGSLALQWPAGRFSDRVDRRLVIAGLLLLAGVAALALALTDGMLGLTAASLVFALWGAGALSFYGIAAAHMADRAEPGQLARATSGLLFVWAVGSVIGPILLGLITDNVGTAALFWYAGVLALVIAVAMMWRRAAREISRIKIPFLNNSGTSVAAAELAYKDEDEGVGPEEKSDA
jgi:MFS family permease